MFDFLLKEHAEFDNVAIGDTFEQEIQGALPNNLLQNDFYIPDEETSTSQLIGTSEERQAFFKELEDEVHRSEMADRGKVGESEVMEKEARRREELRLSREARVFPEVEIDDPSHMLVSVRHVSFGVVTRSFKKEWTVSAVYDWVGSLSLEPEHFSLTCAVTKRMIFRDVKCEAVKRTTLYMCERDTPVPLCEGDKEISFFAGNSGLFDIMGGTTITNREADLEPLMLEQVSSIPPGKLLSSDTEDTALGGDTDVYRQLQEIRQAELDKMHETCIALIDKSRIIEEVLKLYEDEELISKRLSVSFVDAHATGSGPQREMFSLFWNAFFS